MSQSTRFGQCLLTTVAALGFVLALIYAFYTVLSLPISRDEGFLMITVQSFLERQPLYDSLFTQYGPIYYFYEWIIHRALAVPLTHDATRFVCLFMWLATAVLLAIAGGKITRSAPAGLFVFMQAAAHLAALANEPGHPQELIAALLAVSVLVATRDIAKTTTLPVLGAIGAALFLIKINIGVFFMLALCLTLLWHGSDRFRRPALAWLIIASCAILPFILMRRFLVYDWCRNYGLLVATTSIAASITAKGVPRQALGSGPWLVVAAGALVTALATLVVTLLTGTSVRGLLEGIVLTPLRLTEAAVWPLLVPDWALLGAAASVVLAGFLTLNPQYRHRVQVITSGKALFGIAASILFVGQSQAQLNYLLPWVWLAVVRSSRQDRSGESFARMFVAFMAIWQSLQAYPIAGTQRAIATSMLPILGTICLTDALRAFPVGRLIRRPAAAWRPGAIRIAQTLAAAAVLGLFTLLWGDLRAARRSYTSGEVLDLPGARLVRDRVTTVRTYQTLARYLEANCDTFLTCPGMNSFYFWSRKRPPAHLNVTTLSILTTEQEERLMEALSRASKPLIVVLAGTILADQDDRLVMPVQEGASAAPRRPEPLSPFRRVLHDDYAEIHRIGPFHIYAPKEQRAATPQ